MKLTRYAEQILNIYNYFDGAIVVNRSGIVEYYYNSRKDINTLNEKEILGRKLFDIYPGVNEKNSTMMEVVRTGRPLINKVQKLMNYKGETYEGFFSTFPIWEQKRIVGAVEIFLYMQNRDAHMNIFAIDSELTRAGQSKAMRNIVSVSSPMEELKERIAKTAQTDSNVLLCGETGTGKEMVAQAIHDSGRRSNMRFISQNCAAIPENLLESILFGTVRGGFTNAENRMGLFEAANRGTLFLDEINSMEIGLQAKLLKAIEEQKIMRIGGTEQISVDVRIIAATNTDPVHSIENGKLREDLYYRLKVVQLDIPPLRERKEDILPLAEYYINFFNRNMDREIKGLSEDTVQAFLQYGWPGNVRELRNMVESGFNLCEGEYIELKDIDSDMLLTGTCSYRPLEKEIDGHSLKDKLKSYERYVILEALRQCGSQVKAAEKLGISRQTLNNKMKLLNISEPDSEE